MATQVAPGVWRAGTRWVNWYIIDGGSAGLTLIDGGLPRYDRILDRTLSELGHSRRDVRALVLTHGHIDHTGMAAAAARSGATVYLHHADQALARAPRTNRTERSPARYLHYPAMLGFYAHAVREGALRPAAMPPTVDLDADTDLSEIPGRPTVIHTPGHTDGSCVLSFDEHRVLFVGDLLCTINPVTGRAATPQLQTRGSNRNSTQALASLDRLQGLTSKIVLAGHGAPWNDGIDAAADQVRRNGCR